MKPPAASPGRAEKPQLPAPAPPGLARLLLSKSRRGGRSRRAPATSPMFVSSSRGRGRAGAVGEPSSPKVTCIGQVRMRKGKKKSAAGSKAAAKPEKGTTAKGYCRCLKKAFLCGGLFEFDRRRRHNTPPHPPAEVERSSNRRSPWVFSSGDVAVAAAPPKPVDPSASGKEQDDDGKTGVFISLRRREEPAGITRGEKDDDEDESPEPQLVSSATTTPPKNALLLMRCRSAPQNRTSPLTSRFPAAAAAAAAAPSPSPTSGDNAPVPAEIAAYQSPSPRKADGRLSPAPSPSPRRNSEKKLSLLVDDVPREQKQVDFAGQERAEEEVMVTEPDEDYEDEEMRCSSARPLVLQRCKSEPATTAAAKMSAGPAADATTAGCFWANGGSSGRRRHAPPQPPAAAAPAVALTGH